MVQTEGRQFTMNNFNGRCLFLVAGTVTLFVICSITDRNRICPNVKVPKNIDDQDDHQKQSGAMCSRDAPLKNSKIPPFNISTS